MIGIAQCAQLPLQQDLFAVFHRFAQQRGGILYHVADALAQLVVLVGILVGVKQRLMVQMLHQHVLFFKIGAQSLAQQVFIKQLAYLHPHLGRLIGVEGRDARFGRAELAVL